MKRTITFIISLVLISFQPISAAAPAETWGRYLRRRVVETLQPIAPELIIPPLEPRKAAEELIQAAREGHTHIVHQLQFRGLDIGLYGGPALVEAALNGHTRMVQELLEAGVDVNNPEDPPGCNIALNAAAFEGHRGIVKILLNAGANKGNAEQSARDGNHHKLAQFIREYVIPGAKTKSAGKA